MNKVQYLRDIQRGAPRQVGTVRTNDNFIQRPPSHPTDWVQDDIDSFTEGSIIPLDFEVDHAARDVPGAKQADPEISP
jgi:hypothetical protein